MKEVKDMTWKEFVERAKHTDLAIIPVGSVEVFGPHAPMGADCILSQGVARKVAERTGGLLFPLIPVGDTDTALMQRFPGTLHVSAATLRAYVKEMSESVVRSGMKRLLFICPHVMNVWVVTQVCAELRWEHPEIQCALVDYWRFAQAKARQEGLMESGEWAHGHASELCTSVIMYLAPDLVDIEAIREFPVSPDPYPDITKFLPYDELAPSGTMGDPTAATYEKGRVLVEEGVDRIVRFVETAFASRVKAPHEDMSGVDEKMRV